MGTHLRVLSESYPMNTNKTGFRWFSKIAFALLTNVALALGELTLMLLVAYFCQYIKMQKTSKITETLANGYSSESSQRDLSNEYQHDRVSIIFKNLCVFVLWTKLASALEGLREMRDLPSWTVCFLDVRPQPTQRRACVASPWRIPPIPWIAWGVWTHSPRQYALPPLSPECSNYSTKYKQ